MLKIFPSLCLKSDLSKGCASYTSPETITLLDFFAKKLLFIFPFLKVLISTFLKSFIGPLHEYYFQSFNAPNYNTGFTCKWINYREIKFVSDMQQYDGAMEQEQNNT